MKQAGQVTIEVLLILPVFLTIVFSIMEIGYMSFRLIMLNHAAYETARYGSLTWTAPPGNRCPALTAFIERIIPEATLASCGPDGGSARTDPQSGDVNYDLVIDASDSVRLLFPISNVLLSRPPICKESREPLHCTLHAVVRMPIEHPITR